MTNAVSAVVLNPADDVAVALRPLEPGPVLIRAENGTDTIAVRDAVPMGHKFARRDIAAGEDVRKYGEVIGGATEAIAQGAHVHVHNLRSRRAKSR